MRRAGIIFLAALLAGCPCDEADLYPPCGASACEVDGDCGPGAWCNDSDVSLYGEPIVCVDEACSLHGQCAPERAAAQLCDRPEQCASGACAAGHCE